MKESLNTLPKNILREYNLNRNFKKLKKICFVPYSNIFFSTNGNVLTCCYNTSDVLGKYPDQSIEKIWFGENRRKLIQQFKKNSLSLGCNFCRYYLTNKQFKTLKPISYDKYYKAKFSDFPKVLEFEIENNCNLSCIMCSSRVSSSIALLENKQMKKCNFENHSEIYDDQFIEQLEKFIIQADIAKFFGGEPFLIPLYYKIWDKILELNPNIDIFILTNGTIFNEKIAKYIKKGKFKIFISLDALKKDLFEAIRIQASFDQVYDNIQSYLKICTEKGIGFSFTAMKLNILEFPNIINFANQHKADIFLSFLEYPKSLSLKYMQPEQLKNLITYFEEFDFPHDTNVQKHNKYVFEEFIYQLKKWEEEKNYNKLKDINNASVDDIYMLDYIIDKIFIKVSTFIEKYKIDADTLKIIEKINNVLMIEKDYQKRIEIAQSILEITFDYNLIEEIQKRDEYHLLEMCKYYLLNENK